MKYIILIVFVLISVIVGFYIYNNSFIEDSEQKRSKSIDNIYNLRETINTVDYSKYDIKKNEF